MNFPSFDDFLTTLKDGKLEEITSKVYANPELHIFIGDDNSNEIDMSFLIRKNNLITIALLEAYHQWLSENLS